MLSEEELAHRQFWRAKCREALYFIRKKVQRNMFQMQILPGTWGCSAQLDPVPDRIPTFVYSNQQSDLLIMWPIIFNEGNVMNCLTFWENIFRKKGAWSKETSFHEFRKLFRVVFKHSVSNLLWLHLGADCWGRQVLCHSHQKVFLNMSGYYSIYLFYRHL